MKQNDEVTHPYFNDLEDDERRWLGEFGPLYMNDEDMEDMDVWYNE